ncbi:MAG: hypothetical protein HGA85_07055 [Nanoarchaeota archaeon]|nr:hypothetical protein [Nanoarchaeota archaeon]
MKRDVKFEIDQLRKDKMIYALESIAVCFVVEIAYLATLEAIGEIAAKKVAFFGFLSALLFFIYMAIGNLIRWRKIRHLEKLL